MTINPVLKNLFLYPVIVFLAILIIGHTMSNKDMPAYPVSEEETDRIDNGIKIYSGLTKLEAFTLAALTGLCTNLSIKEATDQDVKAVGMLAVELAERTLTELEGRE